MPAEAFLINPARSRRRVYRLNPGLPGPLLSRMMRTYGRKRGMREAWAAYRRGITRNEPDPWENEPGLLNPWETIRYPARTAELWRDPRTGRFGKKLGQKNPLGEEVMIVGNPRRRRRVRRSLLLNAWFGDPEGHRRAALKGWAKRRRLRDNPRRRVRRVLRDNPRRRAGVLDVSLPDVSKPATLVMPAAIGTAAYVATDRIPSMVNMTSNLSRLGVKAAVGIGGGILLSRILGRTQGAIWALGSSINVLSDILRTYVFKTMPVAGLGAFPRRGVTYSGLGAYTTEYNLSNYPM